LFLFTKAVPNSDCIDIPNMRFTDKLKVARKLDTENGSEKVWSVIRALNDLRPAAAQD
jgi:hypothetical protein